MQRDRERLADRHFWEHLSVRAILGWRTCISVEQPAMNKVPTIASTHTVTRLKSVKDVQEVFHLRAHAGWSTCIQKRSLFWAKQGLCLVKGAALIV